MASNCKSCGRPIIWATNRANGARIPLDAVAPVYAIDKEGFAMRVASCHVTHFATCPNATDHSKKKPALQPPLLGDE